jgi:hypothetical protein
VQTDFYGSVGNERGVYYRLGLRIAAIDHYRSVIIGRYPSQ